jgi:tyrosine-protein kinase Etk/Wzc
MSELLPSPEAKSESVCRRQITLVYVLIAVAKNKRFVLSFTCGMAIFAIAISLVMPKIYTGTARILPPQQSQSASMALLTQIAPLAGGMASQSLGLKNPSDLYVGMLRSRTIADRILARFDLMKLYDRDNLVDTRRDLDEHTEMTAGKDGIITVSVEDKDPKRAADMANAYVEELVNLTKSLAVTEAQRRRIFFSNELIVSREQLSKAETDLQKVQEASGLIQLGDQARAMIGAVASVKAQVIAKEAEVAVLRSFATEQNPEFVRARDQLASFQSELRNLQRKQPGIAAGGVIVPTGDIPTAAVDYLRRARDVKYYESLFDLLAKQVELAKIDEGKDAALIQALDQAVIPDKKTKPKRALIVVIATLLAFAVAVGIALIRELRQAVALDPIMAADLASLRRHLKFR